jgi:hypothetical protein
MSALARVGGLFVEARPARVATLMPRPATPPTVAVLCAAPHGRIAASAVALALARVLGGRCALAAMAGADGSSPHAGVAMPAARRAAQRLRERDARARASGRLVWLADRRIGELGVEGPDASAAVAAASAELGRAAMAAGAPAALAIPLARVGALDRVLGWHDGIVVVPEPNLPRPVLERALASLALLGRPVACMAPPSRLEAGAAVLGLHAPASALTAVERLALGGGDRSERGT